MFKKLVLIIIIQSLVLSPLLFMPEKAEAQENLGEIIANWMSNLGIFTGVTQSAASAADAQRSITVPIFDVVGYSQLRAVETAKAGKETKDNIVQELFSIFLESLRRKILDTVVNDIIKWVNGGENGKPQFISNWGEFLKDAANEAISEVVLQTDAAFLCSPFKAQIQFSLLPVPEFSQFSNRLGCTLDDVVDNIENFYEDFENGGWIAYNESWQPQNNYYGQLLMINDEMNYQVVKRQQAVQNEALAGGGFLSVKRCKGGGYSFSQLDAMEYFSPGSSGSYVKDSNGNYCLPEDMEDITPGTVVGEMASKAIGADIDYILSAKELEQYVAAITNALINRVVKEGVQWVQEISQEEKEEQEKDISVYTKPYEDGLTEIQTQEKERIIDEYEKVLNDRNAVLEYKEDSFSVSEQILAIFEGLKNSRCAFSAIQENIDSAKTEIDRLETEIENIKILIDEIESLKNEAEETSSDYRLQEMDTLNNNYIKFLNKYDDFIIQIYSKEDQEAAEEEAQNKKEELLNIQELFSACI
ncbi:hypothetical protein JW698_00935 [Candidatus Wolfebacteria bacterium]|nr:hypothetical protein [Candidatus Wolfebacteria bacterium]